MLGAAAPSKSVAFFGGADNGAGAEAFITTDAGVNFVTSKPGGFSYFDVGATDTQTAVLSGFLGGKRTSDQGKTWESILSPLSQCQSVEKIAGKPNAIGMAGHSGEDNGVAVSDDGGKSWTLHEASPGLTCQTGSISLLLIQALMFGIFLVACGANLMRKQSSINMFVLKGLKIETEARSIIFFQIALDCAQAVGTKFYPKSKRLVMATVMWQLLRRP